MIYLSNALPQEVAVGSFGGGLEIAIEGRLKSLYSVHRKMRRKVRGFAWLAASWQAALLAGTCTCIQADLSPHVD